MPEARGFPARPSVPAAASPPQRRPAPAKAAPPRPAGDARAKSLKPAKQPSFPFRRAGSPLVFTISLSFLYILQHLSYSAGRWVASPACTDCNNFLTIGGRTDTIKSVYKGPPAPGAPLSESICRGIGPQAGQPPQHCFVRVSGLWRPFCRPPASAARTTGGSAPAVPPCSLAGGVRLLGVAVPVL